MLYESLSACREDRPAIASRDQVIRWPALQALINQRISELRPWESKRLAVMLPATADAVATLAALDALACHVFLLDAQTSVSAGLQLAQQMELDALLFWDGEGSQNGKLRYESIDGPHHPPVRSGVTLLTSGTEGPPKAVAHTWTTLARPVRRLDVGNQQIWALCYRIHLYAGLQVLLQALLNHGQLVMPSLDAEPDELVQQLAAHRVGYLSATPSFIRRLLLFADPQATATIPLQQLTMGGEIVDQAVIDGVRQLFPQARIVHIYATSELGRCFAVADRQEGFPTNYLQPGAIDGVDLKVVDGELFVRSRNAMVNYDPLGHPGSQPDEEGWRATGDLVQQTDDRVLFAGRRGDMINVGGNKVRPVEVERVIREVAGVVDVRVFGQASSLAGQLVACEIVPAAGAPLAAIRQDVMEACALRLGRYEIPRLIQFVETIETTAAGKVSRQRS